jgi:hypothetical protein
VVQSELVSTLLRELPRGVGAGEALILFVAFVAIINVNVLAWPSKGYVVECILFEAFFNARSIAVANRSAAPALFNVGW